MNAEITMTIAQFVPVWRFNWWATCRSMALNFMRLRCAVARYMLNTLAQMIDEEPDAVIWKALMPIMDVRDFL